MVLFAARHIHKRFGARVVLEDISLEFAEGEVSGIMGPNGAGKTTCFNVLTGRHRPDRGDIVFDGRSIAGLTPQRIATMGISRSFQLMNLFDESAVIENIMLALPEFRYRRRDMFSTPFADRELKDRACDVLEQVNLASKASLPSKSLSYGERRALEIAVALAARPRLVFLDEPTSGLGSEATQGLTKLVRRLREKYTIVIIEHDMRFLFDLADRISVIHWGQVIAEGTPANLRRNKWVQRSALGELA